MEKRKGIKGILCEEFDMGDFYLCLSKEQLIEADKEKISSMAVYYLHYLSCDDCRNSFGEAYGEESTEQERILFNKNINYLESLLCFYDLN